MLLGRLIGQLSHSSDSPERRLSPRLLEKLMRVEENSLWLRRYRIPSQSSGIVRNFYLNYLTKQLHDSTKWSSQCFDLHTTIILIHVPVRLCSHHAHSLEPDCRVALENILVLFSTITNIPWAAVGRLDSRVGMYRTHRTYRGLTESPHSWLISNLLITLPPSSRVSTKSLPSTLQILIFHLLPMVKLITAYINGWVMSHTATVDTALHQSQAPTCQYLPRIHILHYWTRI